MTWWHGTSIYQVYPRSFADSDGDGIGDLPGIIGKLDYLVGLGIETLWVSPFFASPQRDFGYDITDYLTVSPEYGTGTDAQRLIDEAHRRGMRIMFDLVLNHTSDNHPWFLRSKGSRSNPKADWYIWADGRGKNGRRPPNNWKSAMEVKSAWQWSPERQQWYLATFLPFQPDLNWRNPDVRQAMSDAIRHWLRCGVDGFRLDIFGQIMKDPRLRNNPLAPNLSTGFPRLWRRDFTENTEDNIDLARYLHGVCAEFNGDPEGGPGAGERILLGEVFGSPEVLRDYLGNQADGTGGLDLVFLFDFLQYRYDAAWFTDLIRGFEQSFPSPMQPTYVLENHDRTRSINRVGGDLAKAKVLAVLQLTLRGVPTIYMGQEIGMGNTPLPLRDALDPVAATFFRWLPQPVASRLPETVNRDEMRTPMQWDATTHAGFCPDDVRPWLPVNPDHARANVAAQDGDQESVLNLYRGLLRLRREHPALRTGSLTLLEDLPTGVLGYRRADDQRAVTILANLSSDPVALAAPNGEILASCGDLRFDGGSLRLGADCAAVIG